MTPTPRDRPDNGPAGTVSPPDTRPRLSSLDDQRFNVGSSYEALSRENRENPGRSLILTINGGSSSLKFAIFDRIDPIAPLVSGEVDRIGRENALWIVTRADGG